MGPRGIRPKQVSLPTIAAKSVAVEVAVAIASVVAAAIVPSVIFIAAIRIGSSIVGTVVIGSSVILAAVVRVRVIGAGKFVITRGCADEKPPYQKNGGGRFLRGPRIRIFRGKSRPPGRGAGGEGRARTR